MIGYRSGAIRRYVRRLAVPMANFDLIQAGNGVFGVVFFWAIGLGLGAVYTRFTIGTAGCA